MTFGTPVYLGNIPTNTRQNNLTFIRFVASVSVTFGHSFAILAGHHYDIIPGLLNSAGFGFLAVAVFFALSGTLITQSFERSKNWWEFLEARWLRIFPGLFFANFITAILISQIPLVQGWSAFASLSNWRYVFGAFFFDYGYYDHVYKNLPLDSVNGSLWTLSIEFRMYLFVFAMGVIGLLRKPISFLVFVIALFIAAALHWDFVVLKIFPILFRIKSYEATYLSLPLCFVGGMVVFIFRKRIPLSLVLAGILLSACFFLEHWMFRVFAFSYAAWAFGFHPKAYCKKLNWNWDLSYGIYVLSFPVQQTLVYLGAAKDPWTLFALTMTIVIPLAMLSWNLVEKPALKLRGRLRKKSVLSPKN
jgi:peptidoglycan/LPS O-acetylase OafA/YrhL